MKDATDFNIENAIELANFSRIAYDDEKTDIREKISARGFELVEFFDISATDTQAFIAKNNECIVLAFRGTTGNIYDITSDLAAHMTDGHHEGFFRALDSVLPKIEACLDKLPKLPLYGTGHSLGGALALAALLKMTNRNWKCCYTYGSPPVCTKEVAASNKVPTYRVVNAADIVARLMEINEIPAAVDAITQALAGYLRTKQFDEGQITKASNHIREMKDSMPTYCHFGTQKLLDRTGRFITAEDYMELFNRIVKVEPLRAIEDHKITQYIFNLETYRDNRIV